MSAVDDSPLLQNHSEVGAVRASLEKTLGKSVEAATTVAVGVVQPAKDGIGAIIMDPRCHIALPLTVWNMRTRLPRLPIQVFYGDANEKCVEEWFAREENIIRTKLSSEFWLNTHSNKDMSWIYTNPKFWQKVQYGKVLSFHTDSWICGGDAEAKLKNFVQYDYVGATWPKGSGSSSMCNGGRVGNGGFSLRNVKVMEALAAEFGQTTENEDSWFCAKLHSWNQGNAHEALQAFEHDDVILPKTVVVAEASTAGEFSAENEDNSAQHAPLGMHKVYSMPWYKTSAAKRFDKNCPGIHLLAHANRENIRYQSDVEEAVKKGRELVNLALSLSTKGEEFDDSLEQHTN